MAERSCCSLPPPLFRFCGEAPDAFGPRLRQLLPSLLAYFQAQGDRGGGGGGGEDSPLPFLLPALLQQVVPAAGGSAGRQEQATWVQTLVSEQVGWAAEEL